MRFPTAIFSFLLCLMIIFSQASGQEVNLELLSIMYDNLDDAHDVAVQGSYAYIATQLTGLRVVDVSNPNSPVEVGFVDTPGRAYGVVIRAGLAYVADRWGGLRIINVADPLNPLEIGACETVYANAVAVSGNYAYTTDYNNLNVVDMTDPYNPYFLTQLNLYAETVGIAISGDYAFVAADEGGLKVVNIANPWAPFEVFYAPPIGNNTEDIYIVGNTAYLADGNDGLRIVDITVPQSPLEIGFCAGIGSVADVVTNGNYSYTIDEEMGSVWVVDVQNPFLPGPVDSCAILGPGSAVAAFGDYVYAIHGPFGMHIIDVTDPLNASVTGNFDPTGSVFSVDVSGDYAYVANLEAGLDIIDVSDPENPNILSTISALDFAFELAVVDPYAYISDAFSLKIYDVSNPYAPLPMGEYPVAWVIFDVEVSGDFAYCYEMGNGIHIVDIADPNNPVGVGFYPATSWSNGFCVENNLLFIAYEDYGMVIVDVSDPTAPVEIASYPTVSYAYSVDVEGVYAYVACGEQLEQVNVSNPQTPFQIGWCWAGGHSRDITIYQDYAFVGCDDEGIFVYDVSQPLNWMTTAAVDSFDTPGMVETIVVENGHAYVADYLHFEIFDCFAGAGPVTPVLTPYNPPIIIPESGGNFAFNIAVENLTAIPQTFDLWTQIELPNVGVIEILNIPGLTLPAYATVDRDRNQTVPAAAPGGVYNYHAYAGSYASWVVYGYDSFTFEKEGTDQGGSLGYPDDWQCTGGGFEAWVAEPDVGTPLEFSLYDAHPNPFNPTTTISYALPQASRVQLNVYDLQGRLVAELVNGMRQAGYHEVTFEAQNLASGMYVYQILAGDFSDVKKMVLVK